MESYMQTSSLGILQQAKDDYYELLYQDSQNEYEKIDISSLSTSELPQPISAT